MLATKEQNFQMNKLSDKSASSFETCHVRRVALRALAPLFILGGLTLTGCAVGPDYVRPGVETPAAFKEAAARGTEGVAVAPDSTAVAPASTLAGPTVPRYSPPATPSTAAAGMSWRPAQPNDAAALGKWWEIFGDAQLNSLVEQVELSSQTVAQAEAQFRLARAQLDSARAAEWPDLSLNGSITRSGRGSSSSVVSTSTTSASLASGSSRTSTDRSASLGVSWEVDVWGRLRRQAESRFAATEASAADLAAARLSVQSDLAIAYFKLRIVDAQKELYDSTLAGYRKSVELTTNRYKGGVAARADVVQAETQLKSTQVQAIDLDTQRAQLEHAIALLIGKPASDFSIPQSPLHPNRTELPTIPSAGIPSELLQRRPDIAGAERRVAAANAAIGVAKAAYFPSLSLSASGGYSSPSFANWISAPNRFWSIGPDLALSLFDAGARRAATRQAEASYDASVAEYRQTVLTGFREVEDYLAQLRIYELEAEAQADALESARQSLALVTNQYKAGIVSYLNVISAQAAALSSERNSADILGNRFSATVLLIKALGGGWDSADVGASLK